MVTDVMIMMMTTTTVEDFTLYSLCTLWVYCGVLERALQTVDIII